MVGFNSRVSDLKAQGISVVAASADPIDKAKLVADEVYFPVGYGVSRQMAELLGSWWEDRRQIIQPSEFILGPDNKVLAASYSDGPLARMLADDVLSFVKLIDSRSK